MAERLHAHASLCVRVRMRGLSALAHILSLVFSELSVSTSACSRSAKDVPSGIGRDETDCLAHIVVTPTVVPLAPLFLIIPTLLLIIRTLGAIFRSLSLFVCDRSYP